jgi:S1-C subfamily serine protease
MRTTSLLAAAVLALGFVSRSAQAADESPYAKLLEAKVPTVVSVKSVLKWSWNGGADSERNDERNGVVVDPSGLIMVANFSGSARSASLKISATNIRVLFDGDEKEYEAVLGATDSKLGLAFVRVKDLAGKKVASVNFADGVDVKVGDEVAAVFRTDQGFDYAPYFAVGRIVGQVTKPRAMWILSGISFVSSPLYTSDGKVTGVVVRQQGISEEGSSERTFLLPYKAVQGVVAQAVKASAKALEDAKAHEAEAAAAMSEPAAPEAPAGMTDAPPGAAPGMGSEPAK